MDPEDWAATDQKMSTFDIFDLDLRDFFEKFLVFKEKLAKRFRKPKTSERETEVACRPGDEMTQELTDAWNLFTRVGDIGVQYRYCYQRCRGYFYKLRK